MKWCAVNSHKIGFGKRRRRTYDKEKDSKDIKKKEEEGIEKRERRAQDYHFYYRTRDYLHHHNHAPILLFNLLQTSRRQDPGIKYWSIETTTSLPLAHFHPPTHPSCYYYYSQLMSLSSSYLYTATCP
jgi:hypothetical protein